MWTNRFSPCMCVVRVRACLLWFPFLAKGGRPSRRLGPALEALRVVSPYPNRNVEPPEGSMTHRHATRHNFSPIRTSGVLLQLLFAQVAMAGTIEVKLDYAQFDKTNRIVQNCFVSCIKTASYTVPNYNQKCVTKPSILYLSSVP